MLARDDGSGTRSEAIESGIHGSIGPEGAVLGAEDRSNFAPGVQIGMQLRSDALYRIQGRRIGVVFGN